MNQPNKSLPIEKLSIEKYIDHTLLDPSATQAKITKLCLEAREYKFFAVCVHPCRIRQAYEELKSSGVIIGAPVGFPLGANLTSTKVAEALAAIADGAKEIDMVMNVGALKEGNISAVIQDIEAVVKASGNGPMSVPVKVIIECDLLTDNEKVTAASACVQARAAMVKTCTGFVKGGKGATVEDVRMIKNAIAGSGLGIKASGGIRDYASALALIEAGATRIGTSSGLAIVAEGLQKRGALQ